MRTIFNFPAALLPTGKRDPDTRRPLARLCAPVQYRMADGRIWYVPAGYETDGPSGPWWAYPFLRYYRDEFREPALLHDHLYSTQGGARLRLTNCYSRRECDAELFRACLAAGMPTWAARISTNAVRLGGAGAWKDED